MARLGFASGYDPSMGVREIASSMARAEEAGFEVGLFSETARVLRDAPTVLSAIALATTRMNLGSVQVVRLRSPLVMAQTIATLDELSGGRSFIAPGACGPTVAERHGLAPMNLAQGLMESIEVIRLLLSGEPVSYDGKAITLNNVSLGWKPPRSSVPIYPAATSRRGLQIAGSLGDGVLLDACTSPAYSAAAIAVLRSAMDDVGRDWSKFEVAQIICCSIEDDHQTAIDAMRWEVASKLEPRAHWFQKSRIAVGEPNLSLEDLVRYEEVWTQGGKDALLAAISDTTIEALTASGTVEEVRERVDQYRAAGVTLPILRPAAVHQTPDLLALFGGRSD